MGVRRTIRYLRKKGDHLARGTTTLLDTFRGRDRGPRSLIILDDVFPHLLSSFRIAEYNGYLEVFGDAQVHSTGESVILFPGSGTFEQVRSEYRKLYPGLADRVVRYHPWRRLEGKVLYTVFLKNAYDFLPDVERAGAPFVFTLYPGGGFHLGQEETDRKLRRIFSYPKLAKVIATQKVTRDYLVENGFCEPERVEFLFGGVFPASLLRRGEHGRKRYLRDKETFDLCFVAHKYTPRGADKGFDVFIEVAKILAAAHTDVRFHVVGQFDPSDANVRGLENRLVFHGMQRTGFFQPFYSGMDIILSPNRPFLIAPGQFDGFPTGCCVEAGLCGVAVFCTDPLGLNVAFRNREDIVIVPPEPEGIVAEVERYYARPDALYALSEKGKESFGRLFDTDVQMGPRIRILSEAVDGKVPSPGSTGADSSR